MKSIIKHQLLAQIVMCGISALILAVCMIEPYSDVVSYTNTLFFLHFVCAPILGAVSCAVVNNQAFVQLFLDWVDGINEFND